MAMKYTKAKQFRKKEGGDLTGVGTAVFSFLCSFTSFVLFFGPVIYLAFVGQKELEIMKRVSMLVMFSLVFSGVALIVGMVAYLRKPNQLGIAAMYVPAIFLLLFAVMIIVGSNRNRTSRLGHYEKNRTKYWIVPAKLNCVLIPASCRIQR